MKKIFFNLIAVSLLSVFFIGSSCDDLTNLPVNVPIVVNFSTSGSNTSITESKQFCLSDYQEWRDNQDGVNGASFVSIAYWTESATPNLQGDFTVALSDQFGNQLFAVTLENVKAADYIDNPFAITLDEAQIQAIDDYLSAIGTDQNNLCFSGSLTISNISADSSPYQLTGRVEMVIEADVKL